MVIMHDSRDEHATREASNPIACSCSDLHIAYLTNSSFCTSEQNGSRVVLMLCPGWQPSLEGLAPADL